MALTVTKNSKPFVTDIPEDTYPAVCIGIYDIGEEFSEVFQKADQKVLFLFEIPELVNEEGFAKTLNIRLTQSLNPKSNLFKMLSGWRGKSFKDEELEAFDLRAFLGKPALIQVIHAQGKGLRKDCTYANIQQVSQIPRGMTPPVATREPVCFDFADGVARIPEGTPQFISDMIVASPEWKALKAGGGKPAGGNAPAKNTRAPSPRPGQQAPAEIIDLLNAVGLKYPFDQEDLDALDGGKLSPEEYDILAGYATPF